ncbi:MAG: FG-GAP-like repeat-containing protein [Bacteroidota bacterium]
MRLLFVFAFAGYLCCNNVSAQGVDSKILDYNDPVSSPVHYARESIKIKPGYQYSGTHARYYIDETESFETNYNGTQNSFLNTIIDKSKDIGSIIGSATVNLGSAMYTIQPMLPGASGSLIPELGFSYNHNANNSILGIGWNISGLSSISRGNKNILNDGVVEGVKLLSTDALVLDGNRLIVTAANQCKTEAESFSVVTGNGTMGSGSLWYKVITKEGMTYEYGNTPDSRFLNDELTEVIIWRISKIRDSYGNYMEFKYYGNRDTRIDEINYGGNYNIAPYNKVKFLYDNRSDVNTVYAAGASLSASHLLRSIKITSNGSVYSKYDFAYGYDNICSYLTEVTEFSNGGVIQKSSTRFKYEEQPDGFTNESVTLGTPSNTEIIVGDYNGDGVSDLAEASYTNNSSGRYYHQIKIRIKNATTGAFVNAFTYSLSGLQYQIYIENGGQTTSSKKSFQAIDYNGDGRDDIVLYDVQPPNSGNGPDPIHNNITVLYTDATVSGFTSQQFNRPSGYQYVTTNVFPYILNGDFNGDSKYDFICFLSESHSTIAKAFVTEPGNSLNNALINDIPVSGLPNFSTFSVADNIVVLDYNGDGKTDILVVRNLETTIYEIYKSNGAYYAKCVSKLTFPTKSDFIFTGDFNGDGKTDLYTEKIPSSGETICHTSNCQMLAYSKGNGVFHLVDINNPLNGMGFIMTGRSTTNQYVIISDFNADGKHDILIAAGIDFTSPSTNLYMNYSRGTKFKLETYSLPRWIDPFGFSFIPADMNGDGRTDLLYPFSLNQGIITFKKNGKERFLSQVFDGNGKLTTFAYKRLNEDPAFYVKQNSATFPYTDFNGALYVVSSMESVTGNNSHSVNYTYEGAKLHRQGRGLLGFMKVTQSDATMRSKVISEFELNSTFALLLNRNQKSYTFPANALIKEIVSTNVVDVIAGGRYFSKVTGSIETNHLSGVVTTSSSVYNSEGNIISTSLDIGNGLMTETSTLSNFVAIYPSLVPSLPRNITKQKTRQGQATYSASQSFTYTSQGKVSSKVDFEGMTKKTTTMYAYDNMGNLSSKTVSGWGTISATENFYYDNTGRVVVRYKNPIGQETLFEYHPVLALQTKIITPDGLTGSTVYDTWGREVTKKDQRGIETYTAYAWVNGSDISSSNDPIYISHKALTVQTQTNSTNQAFSKVFYDMLGREIRVETSGFNSTLFTETDYDERGNKSGYTAPYKLGSGGSPENVIVNGSGFDDLNRTVLVMSNDPLTGTFANMTLYAYTYLTGGNLKATITLPDQKITSKTYDPLGKLIAATDNGGELEYEYYSHGGIKTVTLNGSITSSMEYDGYGNQSKLDDKDAGITLYDYDALGRVIAQTDARNTTYQMQYDILGRITQRSGPGGSYTYTYVTSGQGLNKPKRVTAPNTTYQDYTYNKYGQVIKEEKNLSGVAYNTQYEFDGSGQISREIFPNGFSVTNEYNSLGSLVKIRRGDNAQLIWEGMEANQSNEITKYKLGNSAITTKTTNILGFITEINTPNIQHESYSYNLQNGNLDWRMNNRRSLMENFSYDGVDRLTLAGYTYTDYNNNGNIISKSSVGSYDYHPSKTDAVTQVSNNQGEISGVLQTISYTPFNKAEAITEGDYELNIQYGPDEQRIKSNLKLLGNTQYERTYIGNYEVQVANGLRTEIIYISSPSGLCAMYIAQSNQTSMYYTYTDHLGSIVAVTDGNRNIIAEQSFDAWGRIRNATDWSYSNISSLPSWLYRGYTGHEHLPEFSLINMNGRLYDPVLGVMISPDNYAQDPEYTQSYNRYAYCWNNPLKYTDPSGDLLFLPVLVFVVKAAIVGAAISAAAYTANVALSDGGFKNWDWGQFGKTVAIGAASGIVTAGIGSMFGAIGSSGILGEVARLHWHGMAQGLISDLTGGDFGSAYVSGALSSTASSSFMMYGGSIASSRVGNYAFSALTGGLAAELTGGNFWDGAAVGIMIAGLNHLTQGFQQKKEREKYDVDKAIKKLNSQANGSSVGRCAKYVRLALVAGGLTTTGNPVDAKDYGPFLIDKGFYDADITSLTDYTPMKGDIAVIQNFKGGSSSGHIQMYNGTQWVSDFKQTRPFWPGGSYAKNTPSFKIYRW